MALASFDDEFADLVIEVRRIANVDYDRAERKALSLGRWVQRNLPITNDPADGIKRAAAQTEVRQLLDEIRMGRYHAGGSMPSPDEPDEHGDDAVVPFPKKQ